MERFIGNIDGKTDAKGRVFVPSCFRKILNASGSVQLVLRKDTFQDCLVLYPASVWNEELDFLRTKLNKYAPEQEALFRQFAMGTEVLEMDSNGRILIPKRYLQDCFIANDVRFVGSNYTIEIWGREQLEKSLMDTDTFKNSVKNFLGN